MIHSINVVTGEITEIPDEPMVEIAISAEQNKYTAINLLSKTDWSVIADVGNSQISNPYLANQEEFIAYRNAIRQYAVYPVEGNIDWITEPTENWVKV